MNKFYIIFEINESSYPETKEIIWVFSNKEKAFSKLEELVGPTTQFLRYISFQMEEFDVQ